MLTGSNYRVLIIEISCAAHAHQFLIKITCPCLFRMILIDTRQFTQQIKKSPF